MIALIDYGAGNTASVVNVLKDLKVDFQLTGIPYDLDIADKIILPGVGEASFAMKKLHELNLIELIKATSKPFLGICLGMQLLCETTEEGNSDCLGIIPVKVKRFNEHNLKVPHMGWNQISEIQDEQLLNSVSSGSYFYFAHSYFVPINKWTTSSSEYGLKFSASVKYRNFFGVQFHPEKSASEGIKIIKNFLELC